MSFEIENGVLKKYTFDGNPNVVIPDGVRVIGKEAFTTGWHTDSPITSVVIPDSVEQIDSSAFYYCTNLTSVTLPDSITQLYSHIFFNCTSLQSINLPRGIREIPNSMFCGCRSLTKIDLPKNIISIGNYAFNGCDSLTEITLPDNVLSIGEWAFINCTSLKSVSMPDSITSIGVRAFSECPNLIFDSLPANLKTLGLSAFSGCTSLTEITVPDGVETIEDTTFSGCTALERVYLPDSVQKIKSHAFLGCSALKSVHLPKELKWIGYGAFDRCSKLTDITIPDGTKSISSGAFAGCTSLTQIVLPDSITRIESLGTGCGAFSQCTSLSHITLPGGITEIANSLLSGCSSLTDITIPDNVTAISENAFEGCVSLTSICVPANVRFIGNSAFRGCTALRRVTLPGADISIGSTAFDNCPNVSCEITGGINLRTADKLPASLAQVNPDASDEDRAHVVIHQNSKAWQAWAAKSAENPAAVVECCLNLLAEEKKIPAALCKQVIGFMLEREKDIAPEIIVKMIDFLKGKKCKVDTEQFRSIASLLSGGKTAEINPIEAFVQELLPTYTVAEEAVNAIKKGTKVHYASGDGIASADVLRVLVSECAHEWHKRMYSNSEEWVIERLRPGTTAAFSEIAEKIAAALDKKELSAFVNKLPAALTNYRPYMLARCRYADDDAVAEIISKISQYTRGQAAQRYWAENMTLALMHNDTRAAMFYFDKHNRLDEYAKMRSVTALELRDSNMMPQFDFDADGVKRYDIGGNTIEVTIDSDLSFRLFDVKKGKVVRSIPKKTDDPEKAAACAEHLKVFKKEVQDFYKLRTHYMHDLHLSGDALSAEIWHDVYLTHPVLKLLTRLLVWQDETKKSFMPLENGIIDAQGDPYAPQGKITLAHVLSINTAETAAWQKYLTDHSLVQPFAQMWEPIVSFNAEAADFKKRYDDVVISKEERSTLKKSLAAWGVDMRSMSMEREFDARQWAYAYSNESTFSFDDCIHLDYEVDPDNGTTTLGKLSMCGNAAEQARRLNAILLHLDRAAIRSHIKKGDDHAVAAALTTDFTLAQINEFIDLSTESEQTACTALLLSYKNEHFADLADMDEFSLDW